MCVILGLSRDALYWKMKKYTTSVCAGSHLQNSPGQTRCGKLFMKIRNITDVDVVDLRAQADASMPASNNNVKLYNISNF